MPGCLGITIYTDEPVLDEEVFAEFVEKIKLNPGDYEIIPLE